MTYRPRESSLSEHLDKIIECFDELSYVISDLENAVTYRANDYGEWEESHIEECKDIVEDLIRLPKRLKKLRDSTW